jgi:hypothetical protein
VFSQLLVDASPHRFVRQHLAGLDLRESLLDFADEPVVVVDSSLDGFGIRVVGERRVASGC